MKACTRCTALRTQWSEANQQRSTAIAQYGAFAPEALIAVKAEIRARQKWVLHSVGCEAASNELVQLLSIEREKRISTHSHAGKE
jgi:energy-coupling factor transporter ATP-binding protein EcfA2